VSIVTSTPSPCTTFNSDRGEKNEKEIYQYSSKSVSKSLLYKVFGMWSPDEERLAKMINKVGQVFGIGVKDMPFHLSCFDCVGGPVVLHMSQ
jgi:hypothetical protein